MFKFYYGIDSGAKGAIALLAYEDDKLMCVFISDFPTKFEDFIHYMKKDNSTDRVKVLLEKVHALPGQSCTAMFSYGGNFRMAELLAYCLSEEYIEVSPQAWKKHFGLVKSKTESKTEYKRRSVALARSLLGHLYDFKDSKDGQAEAALIALYGKEKDDEATNNEGDT
jgi:hypothetical protein